MGRAVCKPSRQTGYFLFLKKKHAEFKGSKQRAGDRRGNWYDERKAVAAAAAAEWRKAPEALKRELSTEARSMNSAAKRARKESALQHDQVVKEQQLEADTLAAKQVTLLQASFNHGLLSGSKDAHAPLPSTVRPLALADHAGEKGLNPLPIPMHDDEDPEGSSHRNAGVGAASWELVRDTFQASQVSSAVTTLMTNNSSLHGLGDSEFGVSEALLDRCLETCPGFVQCGHNQLRQAHGHVTEKVAENFSVEEGDDIEQPQCCEHLLGRYCLCDIKNTDVFIKAVEMVKGIARLMSKKRTVKLGKQWYLAATSDTFWPIILLQTDKPSTAYGRLATRICFNPLEIDWVHCQAEVKEDGVYTLKLVIEGHDAVDSVSYLKSDSMNEFAVWFSQNYKKGWSCKLFLSYDVEFDPLMIRLKPSHGPTDAMLARTGEAAAGFNAKHENEADDASAAYSFASQLLTELETQSGVKKKRAQNSNSTAAKTGLGKLKQAVAKKGALFTCFPQVVL